MVMQKKIRVVIAKPGMDGHDRGAKVIARSLRDAGMEVIYTGIFQTPESIVETVLQEDVEVLGISLLSGAHLHYAKEISQLLHEHGLENVLFIMGGTIPEKDIEILKSYGVDKVFGPGSHSGKIVSFIKDWVASSQGI